VGRFDGLGRIGFKGGTGRTGWWIGLVGFKGGMDQRTELGRV